MPATQAIRCANATHPSLHEWLFLFVLQQDHRSGFFVAVCSSWRDGRPIYCGEKNFFFDVFSVLCVIVFETASVSVDHILNGKPKSYKKRHCVVVVVVVVFVVVFAV